MVLGNASEFLVSAFFCFLLLSSALFFFALLSSALLYDTHRDLVCMDFIVAALLPTGAWQDLTCKVCMDTLKDPVALWPCGHVACKECVDKNTVKKERKGPRISYMVVSNNTKGKRGSSGSTTGQPVRFDHPLSCAGRGAAMGVSVHLSSAGRSAATSVWTCH